MFRIICYELEFQRPGGDASRIAGTRNVSGKADRRVEAQTSFLQRYRHRVPQCAFGRVGKTPNAPLHHIAMAAAEPVLPVASFGEQAM